MDINKLGQGVFSWLVKKIDRVGKNDEAKIESSDALSGYKQELPGDSVSISSAAELKKMSMELKQDLEKVRADKVRLIKEKIASGNYDVSAQEVARAILTGPQQISEELK